MRYVDRRLAEIAGMDAPTELARPAKPRAKRIPAIVGGTDRKTYCREYNRQLRQCPIHSQKMRERNLKAKYGIDMDEYREKYAAQGGKCAICKRPIELAWSGEAMAGRSRGPKPNRAVIDHCHATGRIRDLLCCGCNSGIGGFHDDPQTLRAGAEYIERHARKASN